MEAEKNFRHHDPFMQRRPGGVDVAVSQTVSSLKRLGIRLCHTSRVQKTGGGIAAFSTTTGRSAIGWGCFGGHLIQSRSISRQPSLLSASTGCNASCDFYGHFTCDDSARPQCVLQTPLLAAAVVNPPLCRGPARALFFACYFLKAL